MTLTADQRARLILAVQQACMFTIPTPVSIVQALEIALSHEEGAQPEGGEAPDLAVFLALKTAASRASLQEGVAALRKGFRIYAKR